MKTYHVRYRNTQGTLIRILTAVQRRTIDLPFVHAEQDGEQHVVTLALEMNAKQTEQVCRDWRAIVDVEEVSISDGIVNACNASDVATNFVRRASAQAGAKA
ncbi:MAG: hypothetical protein CXZ00_03650 [Acidobacteria bacterium]|nr:MAG: hypothetical protein CXZ00_03650 [Acidobacteriota bacterium]